MGLVPDLRAGSPTSGWRCVLRPALVQEAVPPSLRLVLRIRAGFLFSGPGVCGGFNRFLLMYIPLGCGHPLGQKCLFVTLDRERRFTWVVVPFRCCLPFLGSSRRIRTSSFGLSELLVAGGHAFTWLVSGLSSPGLVCCFAMSLRYADLLSCGCAPTACLATGFVTFFPVLCSPAGSGCVDSCGFSSPVWLTTFAMGSPLRGRGCFDPRWNEGFVCFSFAFGMFLRVTTVLRDMVTIWVKCVGRFPLGCDQRLSLVLSTFSFWLGFVPLSAASLSALSLQARFLVVLAEAESLRMFLALSSVFSLSDVTVTCPPP